MARKKKIDVEQLIAEWQERDDKGKNKVNILGLDIEKRSGNKKAYSIRFKEGKKATHKVTFTNRREAEEFMFAFGGKNNLTVAAPSKFLFLGGWSVESLSVHGHGPVALACSSGSANNNIKRRITHYLPEDCGFPPIQKKGQRASLEITEKITSGVKSGMISANFETPVQMDNFVAQMYKLFPDYKIPVKRAVTRNLDTNDLCVWTRARVGDGTKRMELRLVQLNGKDYQICKWDDILSAADLMAASECERVFIKIKKDITEEHCGRSLGA